MKKPKLVNDWKNAPKWLSTQMMAVAASVQMAWMGLPEDMKATIPQDWVGVITTFLLIAGIAGRVVDQSHTVADDENDTKSGV